MRTDGWDRSFLKASSYLAEPFCGAYGMLRYRLVAPLDPKKFDNCSTKSREIGYRILIGAGAGLGLYCLTAAPLAVTSGILALGAASKLLRAIGFALQKEGFTYVAGQAPEKELDGPLKIMSWNVCGIGGGFHYDHGGVIDWRSRLDGISSKIEKEDPDVLILQEVYDAALGEALIEKLQSRYSHFYFHMGKSAMGSVGGCMVVSKCAPHRFTNTDFTTNDWRLKRGFATLEIKAAPKDRLPVARIIGTHLIHGDEPKDRAARVAQVSQIVAHLANQRLRLPTILAGDLNMERDGKAGEILHAHLKHGYTALQPTCTNRLVSQWEEKAKSVWHETIDYISLFKEKPHLPVIEKRVRFVECRISPAYDESYDTKTALSDHQALVARIDLFSSGKQSNMLSSTITTTS